MAGTEHIKKALSPKDDKARRQLHTQGVSYERAENGGFHAEVRRHTADGKHHHTEHHVLNDPAAVKQHLDDHMGDQPEIGGGSPPQEAPPSPMMAGAGGGGAPAPGGDGGGMPEGMGPQ